MSYNQEKISRMKIHLLLIKVVVYTPYQGMCKLSNLTKLVTEKHILYLQLDLGGSVKVFVVAESYHGGLHKKVNIVQFLCTIYFETYIDLLFFTIMVNCQI